MLKALEKVEERYKELEKQLSDPEIVNDHNKMREVAKEHSELESIVRKFHKYQKVNEDLEEAHELLEIGDDKELRQLAKMELEEKKEIKLEMEKELQMMLIPKDENAEKNIIMEIRAGTGGDEAALFAAELFRMYTKYAESKGWKIDVMNSNPTGMGGMKEIIFLIEGDSVYSQLKYESGAHRVQRVPETESSGRIHTSAVTVAVLPEAEDVEVDINQNELKIDVYRSSGPGGQSVNTTDSAVRITHLPTGLVVTCQDEKSQHKNKAKAFKVLRARLLEMKQQEQQQELAQTRKSQVGSGDRSDKIRTYNFPQSRVTDHRINLTLYKLQNVLEGDLEEIIAALIKDEQERKLEEISKDS
jgi:peptide chain release factor 1